MKPSRLRALALWAGCVATSLLVLTQTAEAQVRGGAASGRTRVEGEVKDSEGNPLVGVQVILTNQKTSAKNTRTKSKKNGKFSHPLVEFGDYKITFEFPGYKVASYTVKNVDSQSNELGSFSARFGLAADPKVIPLKPKGLCQMQIVMATEENYDKMAMAAAQNTGGSDGGPTMSTRRHPAEVGKELYELKNYEGALEKFQEAVLEKDYESDPNLYFAMARTHFELGNYPEAGATLDRVVELEGGEPRRGIFYMKALIADREGRSKDAVVFLEKESQPSPSMLTTLGSLYRDVGDNDKAYTTYTKVVEIDEDNVDALMSLGTLSDERGDPAKAQEYFQRAADAGAKAGDTGAAVFFNLGALRYNNKQYRAAAAAYQQAIAIRPDYANAHKELAYSYKGMGETGKAKEHFQRYLELAPNAKDKAVISLLVRSLSG